MIDDKWYSRVLFEDMSTQMRKNDALGIFKIKRNPLMIDYSSSLAITFPSRKAYPSQLPGNFVIPSLRPSFRWGNSTWKLTVWFLFCVSFIFYSRSGFWIFTTQIWRFCLGILFDFCLLFFLWVAVL